MNAFFKDMSVAEQAAHWVAELDDPSEAPSLAAFSAWLKASPQNVEEFLLTAAAWGWFDRVDRGREIEVRKMIEEAQGNVVGLQGKKKETHLTLGDKRRVAIAAALGTVVVAVALAIAFRPGGAQNYATPIGEQRTVKLADGSVVYLNTRSKLNVRYSEHGRDLRLLEGEALFVVEKDPARPFTVTAGDTLIQAVGTQFNVYRQATGTKISVIEGSVRVLGETPKDEAAQLVAGEEAKVAPNGAIAKHAMSNAAEAVAWRERRLVFRDDLLSDIVAEFNRYNIDYRLELADGASGEMRLTGVFRADDPQAMLLFLDANSDLRVTRSAQGATIGAR